MTAPRLFYLRTGGLNILPIPIIIHRQPSIRYVVPPCSMKAAIKHTPARNDIIDIAFILFIVTPPIFPLSAPETSAQSRGTRRRAKAGYAQVRRSVMYQESSYIQ